MKSFAKSGTQRRKLRFESLETRRLLAVLFSEDFDPIQPTSFQSIVGGRFFGASMPLEFHDHGTLYFDGNVVREATTMPIFVTSGTLSFRLRLGATSSPPFENIDQISEQVVVARRIQGSGRCGPLRDSLPTAVCQRGSRLDATDDLPIPALTGTMLDLTFPRLGKPPTT